MLLCYYRAEIHIIAVLSKAQSGHFHGKDILFSSRGVRELMESRGQFLWRCITVHLWGEKEGSLSGKITIILN